MRIFCDFDGTISKTDVTDHILGRFAGRRWEEIEADWTAGRISAADCMRAQIALLEVSDKALTAELDKLELDAGFPEFAAWCSDSLIPLTIVSDGVDVFIRRLLARQGLGHLSVISNKLVGNEAGRMLDQPWLRSGCAAGAGVCKCAIVSAPGGAGPVVFIGDGRSDFCVSGRADILFAKDKLARYAADRGQAHHLFSDFHDVRVQLAALKASGAAIAV